MKVYKAQKVDNGYKLEMPAGFDKMAGMSFFLLKIKKPTGTLITKSLTISDVIPENKLISFIIAANELDEIGIYDYQLINTTNSWQQIGKVLQFYVEQNIF